MNFWSNLKWAYLVDSCSSILDLAMGVWTHPSSHTWENRVRLWNKITFHKIRKLKNGLIKLSWSFIKTIKWVGVELIFLIAVNQIFYIYSIINVYLKILLTSTSLDFFYSNHISVLLFYYFTYIDGRKLRNITFRSCDKTENCFKLSVSELFSFKSIC